MRGPLRRAPNCGAQNRGEAPSPSSLRSSTSPRAAGRGWGEGARASTLVSPSNIILLQSARASLAPLRGERVGVRGPLRRAPNCGAQNRGEAPSPSSLRSSTSPRAAGRGEQAIPFSRRTRARVMPTPLSKSSFGAGSRHAATGGGTGCRLDHAPISKIRKKEAERRQAQSSMMPCQRARLRAKRRALACRRSTTALAAATKRHRSAPVHALPGTELGRSGCYPLPAVPVQRV